MLSGLDSFRYQVWPSANAYTVFLVAGLDRGSSTPPAALPQGLTCSLGVGWTWVGTSAGANDPSHIFTEDCGFAFEAGTGDPLLASPVAHIKTPGGGHTDILIDPGTLQIGMESDTPSNTVVFGAQSAETSAPALFGLRWDAERRMIAYVRDSEGGFVESEPVVVPDRLFMASVTWWYAGRSMHDGGILLQIDRRIVAEARAENSAFYGTRLRWSFGKRDLSGSGSFVLSSPAVWHSFRAARYRPLFSEHGTRPVTWSETLSPALVTLVDDVLAPGDTAWRLSLGTTGKAGRLVDTRAAGKRNYRARFEAAWHELSLPRNSPLTIFESTSAANRGFGIPTAPFRVEARETPAGWQVRATAQSGALQVATPWREVFGSGPSTTIEVQWQAASAPGSSDGGLILHVGAATAWLENLDNHETEIMDVRLGPAGAPSGAHGALFVDRFDSWSAP